MSRVTIKDIARIASVSTATVSRVINANYYVSPEVAERVRDAIDETGYVPNSVARSLKMEATYTIGLVVSDISNQYFMRMARAIEDVINPHLYSLVVCSTEGEKERELGYLKMLVGKKLDALIINSSGHNDEFIAALSKRVPTILIHRRLNAPGMEGDFLDTNGRQGGYLVGELLLNHGHRRLGLINGPQRLSTGRDRYEGFLQALNDAGVSESNLLVYEGDFTFEAGYQGAKLFKQAETPPTAIAAMNNVMTLGALQYCRRTGIEVPDEISIAGYGTIEHRDLMYVEPTYVSQDAWLIGKRAAEMMLERLQGAPVPNREVIFDSAVVSGNSVVSR